MVMEALLVFIQLSKSEVEDLTGGEVPLTQDQQVQYPYPYPPPRGDMPVVPPPYAQPMCDRFGSCMYLPSRRRDIERGYDYERERRERSQVYPEWRCWRYGECPRY